MKRQPQENRTRALSRERLRRRYRPVRVRILFVGEAPPESGRFFYQADSGLYRAVRGTFIRALPALEGRDFLKSFRGLGCYLVDLCGKPVDRLAPKERRKACADGEVRLSAVIRRLRTEAVARLSGPSHQMSGARCDAPNGTGRISKCLIPDAGCVIVLNLKNSLLVFYKISIRLTAKILGVN